MVEESQVIVIDNGAYMCKAGFAGDDVPRSVFPPIIGRPKLHALLCSPAQRDFYIGDEAVTKHGLLNLQSPLKEGLETDWEDMEKVWQYACYNELRIAPEDHPFLISEPPLTPKQSREKLVQVLFETFSVPALNVSNTAVLAILASGRMTGCVLDCGYAVTYSVPVFDGYALPYATLKSEFGGRDLSDYLASLMELREYHFTTAAEKAIINDIKEKLCFCSCGEEQNSSNDLHHMYELPDSTTITLNTERHQCPEAIFQPSLIGKATHGLHSLLFKSIKRCSTETRKDMHTNIILSGGSSMFPGLPERLNREIAGKAHIKRFKVVAPPERTYSTWIGGSILGSLTYYSQKCITKREYEEAGNAVIHSKFF